MQGSRLRVEALGVAGAPAPGRLTTTFRLPGDVVVDTGAVAHALPPAEQARVAHLLLTHAHLDHTLGLPFLLTRARPRVYGLAATFDAVQGDLLNGRTWPDLMHRATWHAIRPGETFEVGPWQVDTAATSHTVPTLAFRFRHPGGDLLLVGDTRLDADLLAWAAASRPAACIVEASFPDADAASAGRFGHQRPADLRAWREALGPDCHLLVAHMKPEHEDAVRAECLALGDTRLTLLQDGDVFDT